jgi:ketosteroid isomerase-like protein
MNAIIRALSIAAICGAGVIACSASDGNSSSMDPAAARAELDAAIAGMLGAYGSNDVEAYFGFFADDATLMTSGGRIQPVAEYHESWTELIGGGGGVASVDANAPRTVRMLADGAAAVVATEALPASYRYPDGQNDGEFVVSNNVWTTSITWAKVDGAWKIMHYHYHDARD